MYTFSNWSMERKIRSLCLMDDYIKKHTKPSVYEIEWLRHSAHPFQKERLNEIASDEAKFINAVFCFYTCLTTDLSWFPIVR